MKNSILYKSGMALLCILLLGACTKDLNRNPVNSITADAQYKTAAGYKEVVAKMYGSYTLISSNGVGTSDVTIAGLGSDQAPTDFTRAMFNMQTLTTDEDVCAWNDANLQAFHNFNWTATNPYIEAIYRRSLYQITVCNELIRQSSDALISSRGFTGDDAKNIKFYRAEARFLRAYQYWVLMDLFGNPPFVTENDPVGKFMPPQKQRKDVFAYIEAELKALEADLPAPHTNEYGRADQAAAQALLARIYLNAEVYTGTPRYTDAITYAQKVINDGYTLLPHYKNLFTADNNIGNTEQILSIAYDATNTQNYGGTTFLICSAHGTDPTDNAAYGIPGGGWLGNRSTKKLPQVFGNYTTTADKRALFGLGTPEINNEINFSDGLDVTKFSNLNSDGSSITPPSPNGVLVSTDFPLFRLAEMYLVYIEAVARGGTGGDNGTGLSYFNKLRERAYESTTGDVTSYTLDEILNERQKELFWEGSRRTDLIRYGYFTSGTFVWPWKGGVSAGTGVDNHYNLYPLPSTDIITNTNLVQNPGY